MFTTRRRFLTSVLAPAGVALLAACAPAPQASQPTAAPAPAGGAPAPTTAPAAPKPAASQASGTLTVGVPVEPATMNPQFGNGLNEFMLTYNTMEGLVIFG